MSIGTHITHCCKQHGCKYGNADCPVTTYNYQQSFPCEYCYKDISGFFAQNTLNDYYIVLQVMEEFVKHKFNRNEKVIGIQAFNNPDQCFVYFYLGTNAFENQHEVVDLNEFNEYYRKHRLDGIKGKNESL